MVFWRKSDGAIAALEDACWHRLLPLSMGWLEGDEVVCRYHGLAFDGKGQCTRMPSQDKIESGRRASARILSWSDFASSGCGPAIPRSLILRLFQTYTGTTIPNGKATERRCSPNATTGSSSTI